MLTSYWVACPDGACGWAGSLVPSRIQGGGDAEISSRDRAWFRCPRCERDWEVRISGDRVTPVPAPRPGG